jgi:uncharacterized integral membrane protein
MTPTGSIPDTRSGSTGPAPAGPGHRAEPPSAAAWFALGAAVVVLIGVFDFIIQNLHDASVHFFTLHFRLPVGVLILLAVAAGAVIVGVVSLLRAAQRRSARRSARRQGRANPSTGGQGPPAG